MGGTDVFVSMSCLVAGGNGEIMVMYFWNNGVPHRRIVPVFYIIYFYFRISISLCVCRGDDANKMLPIITIYLIIILGVFL